MIQAEQENCIFIDLLSSGNRIKLYGMLCTKFTGRDGNIGTNLNKIIYKQILLSSFILE